MKQEDKGKEKPQEGFKMNKVLVLLFSNKEDQRSKELHIIPLDPLYLTNMTNLNMMKAWGMIP